MSRSDAPKTKPGVTGFVQEYNQEPSARQDLNPDAVSDDSVLPEPLKIDADQSSRKRGKAKRGKK